MNPAIVAAALNQWGLIGNLQNQQQNQDQVIYDWLCGLGDACVLGEVLIFKDKYLKVLPNNQQSSP